MEGLFVFLLLFAPFMISAVLVCLFQWLISKKERSNTSLWVLSILNGLFSLVVPVLVIVLIIWVAFQIFGHNIDGLGYEAMIDLMFYPVVFLFNPFAIVLIHWLIERKREGKKKSEHEPYLEQLRNRNM